MDLFLETYRGKYGQIIPGKPNQEDKAKYYRDKIQFLYSQFAHESGNLIYAKANHGPTRRANAELRDYARGLQSTGRYLREIGYDPKEVEKFQSANISHQPFPIYPKFRNIMLSKISDLGLKPIVKAADAEGDFERLLKKSKMKLLRTPETQENIPAGLTQDGFPEARTPQDVDFLFESGGIMLPVEVKMKDALDITAKASGWEVLEKMVGEDLIDLGGMAIDTRFVNGKIVLDYVDFARVIIRPSIYPDFRDSDVRGYTTQRKISELLMEHEEEILEHWGELKEAYEARGHLVGSPWRHQENGYREDYAHRGESSPSYSDFGATILKMYWVDREEQKFVVGRHPRGSLIFEQVPDDFVLSDRGARAGKLVKTYPIQKIHQCHWIIGTNIIFGYGPVDTVVREGENGAKQLVWPMTVVAAQEPSMTEKVIPYIDDAHIAILKRRDLITKMPPGPRMLVYKNRIRDSVTMGEKTYSFRDILKMYQREGFMLLDEEDDYSMPGEDLGSKTPPIEFLPSGIMEDLQILEQSIAVSLDRIREITGINPLIDGTATKADILKTVAESMRQSSSNALRPWVELYIYFYKQINESLIWRYQVKSAAGEIDLGYLPSAESTGRRVVIASEVMRYNLGLKVEIADAQYYQFLLQDLMSKRDAITPEGYFAVFNALQDRDLKKAEYLLIMFTRQAEERAHQRQLELVQAQSRSNAEAGVAVEQERQKSELTKLQKELEKMREEAGLKEQMAVTAHQRELEKIAMKAKADSDGNLKVVRENKNSDIFQQGTE